MTSTITRPAYVGPLPRDVERRLRRLGASYVDPETEDLWTHEGETWSRWAAPEVHDRYADYSPAVRAQLAPTGTFDGPIVEGWAVRWAWPAMAVVERDGTRVTHETFAPRCRFEVEGAPLTLTHEKPHNIIGRYLHHKLTAEGLLVRWQLRTELPEHVRRQLGDPDVRPQLSLAFGSMPDRPPIEWPSGDGDGTLHRAWMGVKVGHIAVVPTGAYWFTDLDLVEEFS